MLTDHIDSPALKEALDSYYALWRMTRTPGERLAQLDISAPDFQHVVDAAAGVAPSYSEPISGRAEREYAAMLGFALIMFGVGRAYGIVQATGGSE